MNSRLPVLGAALSLQSLRAHRDWLLARQRDLEIQDFFEAETLDGDWRGRGRSSGCSTATRPARNPRAVLGLQDRQPGSADPPGRHQAAPAGSRGLRAVGATQMVIHSPYTTWDYNNLDDNPGARASSSSGSTTLGDVVKRAEHIGCETRHREHRGQGRACPRPARDSFRQRAVRVSIDTGHANYAHVLHRRPAGRLLRRCRRRRAAHVHLQDTDGYADRHWLPGEGNIRWAAVFRALGRLIKPRLIIEVHDQTLPGRRASRGTWPRANSARLAVRSSRTSSRPRHRLHPLIIGERRCHDTPHPPFPSTSAPPRPAVCCCRASRSRRPTTGPPSPSRCRRSPTPTRWRCCASSPMSASACSSPRCGKRLIAQNWLGKLEAVPGLATEWRRIDDQTVELKLRQGVKFHNGDEMTAEDVVFSASAASACSANTEAKNRTTIKAFEQIPAPRAGKELPPEVPAVATPRLARPASASRPSTSTRCASTTRRRT